MQIKIIQDIIDFGRGKKQVILPSPQEKVKIINEYAKEYNCKNLIETGTYLGDTIEATKAFFEQLYTIELSEELYEKATERFKNDIHIKVIQGDSAKVLPQIMDEIEEKTLFWLDGHYSAGITAKSNKNTPILEEIDSIYNAPEKIKHVILVDDARLFGTDSDYPSIEEFEHHILSKWPNAEFKVKNDIIRIII